jgi:uncharacterized protein YdaU (DUF1376 family)
MASKADTWMPFYVADYLKDTMHLTRDQHGGYMLLLMACWNAGGRIPNDPAQLAALAKATPAEWRKMSSILLRFFQVDGDDLVHGRVLQEREKAQRLSDIRRENGGKGGRPKKQTETGKKATGLANEKLTETPSPSPVGREAIASTPTEDADASSVAGGDVATAFAEWNALAARLALPQAKDLTPVRRKLINARLAAAGLSGWREALAAVEASPHCRGANDRGWRADLDFVATASKFQKLREGSYGPVPATAAAALPAATFDGPPDLRAAVVREKDEDYARRWLDHYCRWRPADRTLLCRTDVVARTLSRDLAGWLERAKVRIEVAPANDASTPSHGAAA